MAEPMQTSAEANPNTCDTTDAPPSVADAAPQAAPDSAVEQQPYFKVFGPDTGVFQFTLPADSITIGRSEAAHLHLPHQTVSRVHALIGYQDGQYVLEDANSNFGTIVNGKRIDKHTLRHGDSIQISMYVLQYRTHPALPGVADVAGRARQLLRAEFHLLPSTMNLRVRLLHVEPREIFRSGDTLVIGQGGLLIPCSTPPGESTCLELDLIWPNGRSRQYLGEILGVLEHEGLQWMCVKLHMVEKDVHEVVVEAASPGTWIDIAPT